MSASAETVLNVDHGAATRHAKSRTLRGAGFRVLEAGTGAEALRLAAAEHPALVLLDVDLPDIGGLEVCRRIKQAYPAMLVLQCSASLVQPEDRVRGLEGGADSFLTEPVAPAELVAAVRALLRLRRAERAAQESESRYRAMIDSATDYAILTLDRAGRVTTWNPGAERILGFTAREIVGHPVDPIFTPEDRAAARPAEEMREARETGGAPDERWMQRRDGERFWADGVLRPLRDGGGELLGYLKILRDGTERRRTEALQARWREELERLVAERTAELKQAMGQLRSEMAERERTEAVLRQAQRMEALGQLAGGIAHDFNNVLQAVLGGLSLIGRRAEDPRAVRQLARMAGDAAGRGAAITARLLAFARKSELRAMPVPSLPLLENLHEILASTLGSHIIVRIEVPPDAPPLLADKAQLETVLVNLAVNARDAMPTGGVLTVSASPEEVVSTSTHPAGLDPGCYVRLELADTGAGMDAATLARASEPFFTTKPAGQGTGLGLAMARGFAQQSGGGFSIRSVPGQGTTVILWFPKAIIAAEGPARPEAPLRHEAVSPRVLVVDDDTVVREVLTRQLRELGYRVAQASDGLAALAWLDAGEHADLLVSDFAMPGMNGLLLIEEARRRRPGLPVLLLTGYVETGVHLDIEDRKDQRMAVLRKPVSAGQLAERAEALLGSQAAPLDAGVARPGSRD